MNEPRCLGSGAIILTGGGEPTLCPDFEKITAWLERNEVHYGINSNFNVLKYFKPDYLKVSLDGYDEDSYEKARGVRKYSAAIENIKAFAEWKREESPKTSLGIQFVANDSLAVKRFYAANKGLDVDYIAFRPMESTAGKFYGSQENIAAAIVIFHALFTLIWYNIIISKDRN